MALLVPSYPVRQKLPLEQKALTFDFTAELAPGTTLTGTPTVTITPPLVVGAGFLDPTATMITVLVSGGAMGQWGQLSCRCGATDGQVHEIDVVVEVAPV